MAFPTFPEGFACKQWHFRLSGKALRANNGISDFPEKPLHANNGNLKIYNTLLSADSYLFDKPCGTLDLRTTNCHESYECHADGLDFFNINLHVMDH